MYCSLLRKLLLDRGYDINFLHMGHTAVCSYNSEQPLLEQ
jgi:hypothetical protein